MTNRELKNLKRAELLEMLLAVTKENEELHRQNEALQAQMKERILQLEKAGSIAEAALQLNKVFEAAQAAADQYLANVQAMGQKVESPAEALPPEAEDEAQSTPPQEEPTADDQESK